MTYVHFRCTDVQMYNETPILSRAEKNAMNDQRKDEYIFHHGTKEEKQAVELRVISDFICQYFIFDPSYHVSRYSVNSALHDFAYKETWFNPGHVKLSRHLHGLGFNTGTKKLRTHWLGFKLQGTRYDDLEFNG